MTRARIIQICPAEVGWRIVEPTPDGFAGHQVVLWALCTDGRVVPLCSSYDGGLCPLGGDRWWVLAPGETLPDLGLNEDFEIKWTRFSLKSKYLAQKFNVPHGMFLNYANFDNTDQELQEWAVQFQRWLRDPRWVVLRICSNVMRRVKWLAKDIGEWFVGCLWRLLE